MKTKCRPVAAACLAASLLALLVGCPHPMGSPRRASLTVSIKNSINARVLLPSISMEAASYTVVGEGPNGASFSESTNGDPLTVQDLPFGTWTVTVNALNNDVPPTIIGQGQDTATLTTGQNTTVTITVIPLGGNGSLDLTVTWTASLQNPAIQASLTPFGGADTNLDLPISGTQAHYASSTVAAGYYTLTLRLLENGAPVMGAVEVVRIVYGQTTSGVYDFSNVNRGTMVVNINPQLANPIPVSISGVPSAVSAGSSITAAASVGDRTGNVVYAWYLNGASLPNSGPNLMFGSDLIPGYYRLDVTAFTADGLRAGSATATFQVGASVPLSLVGSWNFYRAWFRNINPINQFAADGTFIGWEDYAETVENNNGTWSLTGNIFTLTFINGGPGAGVSLSGTLTSVNANQAHFSVSNPPASVMLYRKGFEPDGYLFNNPKYPPIPLGRDTLAQGTLASDGLALYQYVAGPNAQSTVISLTGSAQLYVYESDQQTFVDRISKSTQTLALAPYQTYYVVATPGPLSSGDYSILVTEVAAYAGTWVNPSYNGNYPQFPGKAVFAASSVALYINDTDATPVAIFPLTFTSDWMGSDGHYFRLIAEISPPPSPSYRYTLIRVSNNNSTLEVNSSATDYPMSIDQNGEGYQIYYRQ